MYGRNAAALSEALRGAVASLAVEINPRQPRRNSFEVSLVKEDGSSEYAGPRGGGGEAYPGGPDPCPRPPAAVQLWSGIGKGPPRKLKFPEPAAVVEALRSSLA